MSDQKTTTRHGFNADWPLPDDYLLELGRMVGVWAQLDRFWSWL